MKLLHHGLTFLIALLATSASLGADLMLRERATQHGSVIRLGDIANIAASSSAEVQGLASTPLLPAPAAGTQQFLTAAEVRQLLLAHGVRSGRLTIGGAEVVEIGAATPLRIPAAKPLPSPSTRQSNTRQSTPKPSHVVNPLTRPSLTQQDVETHVKRAIESYLQEKTSVGRWQVEVSLREDQVLQVRSLAEELHVRGRPQPRSGRERFLLRAGNDAPEFAVIAAISKLQAVVVAKQAIERGQLISAADLEIREQAGSLPSDTIADLQQVVGQEAQRAMRSGTILRKNSIREPLLVRRGETVVAFVRTGGVSVRTQAVAKASGAFGELITLETLEGRQRLDASVSGPGEVTIYATGGRATDYASLNRDAPKRR